MLFSITGTGRSGTTLLRNIFNSHSSLFVFHETHWIPKMYEFFGTGQGDVATLVDIIEKTFHVTGKKVTYLDKVQLDKELAGRTRMTVAEFCDVVGLCFARAEGKHLWADKTPDYGPYLGTLQRLWPKCKIIHLVRHGLETAQSMSHHPGFRWMAAAGDYWWVQPSFNNYYQVIESSECPKEKFVELWYWRFQRIRNEATRLSPGSYLEVRFEDLIECPAKVLSQIAGFINLPASEEWLQNASGIVDTSRVHFHAENLEFTNLKQEQKDLLISLGYDIPR